MDQKQNNIIKDLSSNIDKLLDDFIKLFPTEVGNLISKKNLSVFKKNYIEKYKKLCALNTDVPVTSSCLLDRYICSKSNHEKSKQFDFEIKGIVNEVKKVLENSRSDSQLHNEIGGIIKNLILSIDVSPDSTNNDYRNRLNEILVFNLISENKNIKGISIEKKIGNGKSCDFECKCVDGSIVLLEVLSINNLDVKKQDNSLTFSEFIQEKIEKKYKDKTKNLNVIPDIRIFPILEYVEGLENFDITISLDYSIKPYTVIKNKVNDFEEICLETLEDVSEQFRNQMI
jgi:hypothetical protein